MLRSAAAPVFRLFRALVLLALASTPAVAVEWRSIGPEGGSIRALAAAPSEAGVVYAVTGRGNVLASSDGAASWSYRGAVPTGYVRRLLVDPARPDILYATTLAGIFRSLDGGNSWSSLVSGVVWGVAVDPSAPDVLYLSWDAEVFKSTDGGASWRGTGLKDQIALDLAVDPADPRVVYAARPDGFYRSEDGGTTWQASSSGLLRPDGNTATLDELAIDSRHGVLYVLGDGSLFKSTDRGRTWTRVWEGPRPYSVLEDLRVDPGSGALYLTNPHDAGVFRSTDGAATWSVAFSGNGVEALAVDARSTGRVYLGTRAGGLRRSEDGGSTWVVANRGLRDLAFLSVVSDPHHPGRLFAVGAPDLSQPLGFEDRVLFQRTDYGASWTSPFGSPEDSPAVNDLVADPSRPGVWYLAVFGGVLKTEDGGQTWRNERNGLRWPDYIASLALAPSDPDRLYAIGWDTFPICFTSNCPRVVTYRSVDGAAQWRRARVPGLGPGYLIWALAVDSANPAIVYAGPGLYKSTDGGATWGKTGHGLRGHVVDLAADPFSAGTLYAAIWVPHGRRVFKSTDGGATWAQAANGLPAGVSVEDLAAHPSWPGVLYAATGEGVYVTYDGGRSWAAMLDEAGIIGKVPVLQVAIDPFQIGVVYAATPDGLFGLVPTGPGVGIGGEWQPPS